MPPAPSERPFDAIALAVFTDLSTHWTGRFLPRRFRHAFVCVHSVGGRGWVGVEVDSRIGPMVWAAGYPDDLIDTFRAQEWVVLKFERPAVAPLGLLPFRLLTCVGMAKVFLNIRAPLVITPHQLYRHLLKLGAKEAI